MKFDIILGFGKHIFDIVYTIYDLLCKLSPKSVSITQTQTLETIILITKKINTKSKNKIVQNSKYSLKYLFQLQKPRLSLKTFKTMILIKNTKYSETVI